jgi:DNA polymerase III subunit gamma/tau
MPVKDSLPVRHRPASIREVVGQKYAKSVLKGALKQNKVPKTILLEGPTGCGKTTLGRIIAASVNCQKRKGFNICLSKKKKTNLCDSCKLALTESHPDIHELNMAYSRGINEVKQLVDNAAHLPSFNYRVFLLDEFQQVTPHGVQAILKPLEKPPAKTMWILATMQQDKVPESVQGRSLKLPLVPLSRNDMAKLIRRVANKEDFSLGDKAISWVTSMSSSRPRDALSILESLFNLLADREITDINEIPEDVSEVMITSGAIGTGPMVLILLSLMYVKSPLIFAFLQKGVTGELLQDLFYFQDSFVAHIAYGNKSWRWRSVLKIVTKVLKDEIRFEAYTLPIKYHIYLCSLLGQALVRSRQYGDAGVALRQAVAEWFMLDTTVKEEE